MAILGFFVDGKAVFPAFDEVALVGLDEDETVLSEVADSLVLETDRRAREEVSLKASLGFLAAVS